jgi:hypothetical protein
MIQHEPWRGSAYPAGIDGQRICVVGYSHWLGEGDKDTRGLTKKVVSGVIDGRYNFNFFNQISRYFGFHDNTSGTTPSSLTF